MLGWGPTTDSQLYFCSVSFILLYHSDFYPSYSFSLIFKFITLSWSHNPMTPLLSLGLNSAWLGIYGYHLPYIQFHALPSFIFLRLLCFVASCTTVCIYIKTFHFSWSLISQIKYLSTLPSDYYSLVFWQPCDYHISSNFIGISNHNVASNMTN